MLSSNLNFLSKESRVSIRFHNCGVVKPGRQGRPMLIPCGACLPEDLADVFSAPVRSSGVVAGEGFQKDQVGRVLGIVSGMETIKFGQDRRSGSDVQAGIEKLPVIDIPLLQVLRIDLH